MPPLPPSTPPPPTPEGPFRADALRPGDPYELSHGHPLFSVPSGARASSLKLLGAAVVAWDPAVSEVGVDTGCSPAPGMLRAPDVAVGHVPAELPGWAPNAPTLAIEYVEVGQDEARLAQKIRDLLGAGTRWIWIVRLKAPRHVEVHAPHEPPRRVFPGDWLRAPGVLQNPVPVEALYERAAAQQALFASLLQREGYTSLASLRQEGLREGRCEGLRQAVRDVCDVLGVAVSSEEETALLELDGPGLTALLARLKHERRWPLP